MIKDLPQRLQEIGRLRTGSSEKRGRKTVPVKLETWRLTTSHLEALNGAAKLYGGEVRDWAEAHGEKYELVTETAVLDVLVPPQDLSAGQYLEAYGGGGIVRRCDGETELISGAECLCASEDERSCLPTTHLAVLLPQIAGLGTWRLTTRGYNAAAELQGAMAIVDAIRVRQQGDPLVAAELVMDQRQKVTEGKTHNFVVPVLRLPYSLSDAGLSDGGPAPALPAVDPSPSPTAGSTSGLLAGSEAGELGEGSPDVHAGEELTSGPASPSPACDHRSASGKLLKPVERDGLEVCPKCGVDAGLWDVA